MKTKIFIVSFTSFTESDNYLYNDILTFTNEEEARAEFEKECNNAYEECQWGSSYDMSEEEREEDGYEYDVEEERSGDCYNVSSDAYDGFSVEVSMKTMEVEVPYATDRRRYGMTLQQVADQIADFTGDRKGEAKRKAKIMAQHISLRHVSDIVSIKYGHRTDEHGNRTEDHNWLEIEWRDLDGDRDTFSIIE